MDIYAHNLITLDKRFGRLVAKLQHEHYTAVPIERTRTGALTLRLYDAEGKKKYVHSTYDPEKEAHAFVGGLYTADSPLFVVCGYGCGYHVKALQTRLHPGQSLIVVEPAIDIFFTMLHHHDIRPLCDDERIVFIVKSSNDDAFLCMLQTHILGALRAYPGAINITFIDFYERVAYARQDAALIRKTIEKSAADFQMYHEYYTAEVARASSKCDAQPIPQSYREYSERFAAVPASVRILSGGDILYLATYYLIGHYADGER